MSHSALGFFFFFPLFAGLSPGLRPGEQRKGGQREEPVLLPPAPSYASALLAACLGSLERALSNKS